MNLTNNVYNVSIQSIQDMYITYVYFKQYSFPQFHITFAIIIRCCLGRSRRRLRPHHTKSNQQDQLTKGTDGREIIFSYIFHISFLFLCVANTMVLTMEASNINDQRSVC